MMQKIKRPLSILLSLLMIVSLFTIVPITASAAPTEPAEETITINSGTDKLSNHGIQNLHYGDHSDFWQRITLGNLCCAYRKGLYKNCN